MTSSVRLPNIPLSNGIIDDYVDCTSSCGLNFHVLKAGTPGNPLVLFTHGYPELAYSWRKIMPEVARRGYFCVAMDQRGYGRTTGWPKQTFQTTDLGAYVFTNLVRGLVCLVYRLGYTQVHCVVGHDFGAVSSAMAALMRPDMFQSTVQMSHPYHPPAEPQLGNTLPTSKGNIQDELAKLDPPRKHYKWYNSTPEAASDWDNAPQGLEAFLRGYFHLKSADWVKNEPHPIPSWGAEQLKIMPEYYIMRQDKSMPDTVAENMRDEDIHKTEKWLSTEELKFYCQEWERTGFQGALNWYRAQTASTAESTKDMLLFAGRRIEVPCTFISGSKDWGNYQQPGALDSYNDPKCVADGMFKGIRLIDGAGHWVQQEQPEAVVQELLAFLDSVPES